MNKGGPTQEASMAHRHHLIVEAASAEAASEHATTVVREAGGECNDVEVMGTYDESPTEARAHSGGRAPVR